MLTAPREVEVTPRRPVFGEMPWVTTERRLRELEETVARRLALLEAATGGEDMLLKLDTLTEKVDIAIAKIVELTKKVADLEAAGVGNPADDAANQAAIDALADKLAAAEGTGGSEGGITA